MKDIVVIGAGKIGSTIAGMLAESGDYRVTIADRDQSQLDQLHLDPAVGRARFDAEDASHLPGLLKGKFAVLSAAPFQLTTRIADAAKSAERALSRPDRGCGKHAPCDEARRGSKTRLHSAMRPGAGLHHHRRP